MKKRLVSIVLLMSLLLAGCGTSGEDQPETGAPDGSESVTATEPATEAVTETEPATETEEPKVDDKTETGLSVRAAYPAEGETVVLANDDVYGWWDSFNFLRTDSTPFYQHADIYYPKPLNMTWEASEGAEYYLLYLSRNADMSEAETYLLAEPSMSIDSLFTGTKYYWQVDAVYADCTVRSSVSSFVTAESPRTVQVDGASNTRDIGGLPAGKGYRVKQGMVYRGGTLDEITAEGKAYMLEILGIQTDLDLRSVGEGSAISPLGRTINYQKIPGPHYGGVFSTDGKEAMAKIFRLFADESNYPIYFHCTLGRDRTGSLALLLLGLLGVDRSDIMMDYELSVFSVRGTYDNASIPAIRSNIQSTYNNMISYTGRTFKDRVEAYLLNIGITAEEIQSIRDILLEEVE